MHGPTGETLIAAVSRAAVEHKHACALVATQLRAMAALIVKELVSNPKRVTQTNVCYQVRYWHLVTVVVVVVVVVVAVVNFAITLTAPRRKNTKSVPFLRILYRISTNTVIEICCWYCCHCCCCCCCRSYFCTFAKKGRKHCPFSIYRIRNVSSYHQNM